MPDLSEPDRFLIDRVAPYTMTSPERCQAVIESVRHVVRRDLPGAFVECGVWRGGSVLAMLLTLQELGVTDRDIWLYDTFEGMTEPGKEDRSPYQAPALSYWNRARAATRTAWENYFNPNVFSLAQVQEVLYASGYPKERLHFIQGPVEETLPAQIPGHIALLRLDTDWYASTQHEMQHLYPRLADGGVLIIDDYGHWEGCRQAVDEYFASGAVSPVLLQRIDYTARLAIKS